MGRGGHIPRLPAARSKGSIRVPCLVCGNPVTVESHLVPRALYRDVAGDQQHAFAGSTRRLGTKFEAKGTFDRNLLCSDHEAMLGAADQYGIRFLRQFEVGKFTEDGLWAVPNISPDLLVRFVSACVWRRSVSPVGVDGTNLALGPWEFRLRAYLFGETSGYEPMLVLRRQELLLDGQPLGGLVLMEPHRERKWGRRSWLMIYGTCSLILILDERSERRTLARLAANNSDPALAFAPEPTDWVNEPGLVDIIRNMNLKVSD